MVNGFIVIDDYINMKQYDGRTDKFGITIDGQDYIVKFRKGEISSLYSEYVASRFISELGIEAQEVWLGYYNGELVNIVKDFVGKGESLRAYRDTKQRAEDIENLYRKEYTYGDVVCLIYEDKRLSETEKETAVRKFWRQFIIDAILGNRDRHMGNWGYLIDHGRYRFAPLYDNGGSLFPGVSKYMQEFEKDEYGFIEQRSNYYPASLIRVRDGEGYRGTNYKEVLESKIDSILTDELSKFKENTNVKLVYSKIRRVVNSTESIPMEYKRFYTLIVCVRYLYMIWDMDVRDAYDSVKGLMQYEYKY